MLFDKFNRKIEYLRVSVTERCNFRCLYCMPEKPFSWVPKENILSYEELFMFIKIAIDNGVKKIRITGGEPLVRENLDHFIKMISDYSPDVDLCMTTNGYLLNDSVKKLKDSGLKRLNVSLDSLKKEVAFKIAQKDVLDNVLGGIQKAIDEGIKVKINMVPLKGINDNEIVDILEFCERLDVTVRFIEFMENVHAKELHGLNSDEIKEKISQKYSICEIESKDKGPSKYFKIDSGYEFGIIEPHKDDFCQNCNRIRLSAEGYLIPCLFFDDALSIKEFIKNGDINGALEVFKKVVSQKPEKNRWVEESSSRAFYYTGG